jgi:hypothetical protein
MQLVCYALAVPEVRRVDLEARSITDFSVCARAKDTPTLR